MDSVVQWVSQLPAALILVVLAAMVLSETAVLPGIVVPSMTFMLLAGFLARVGDVNPVATLGVAIAAALVGDNLAYREGTRIGPRLRTSKLGKWVGDTKWDKAEDLLARKGGSAVFVARLIAVVRSLLPRLAGAAHMPWHTFAVWNLLAVVTWAMLTLGAGYLAGASYDKLVAYFGQAAGALGLLAAAVIALVLLGRWLSLHPDPVRQLTVKARPLRKVIDSYLGMLDRLQTRYGTLAQLAVRAAVSLALMLVIGLALAFVVRLAVRISGLSKLDPSISTWMFTHHDSRLVAAAEVVVALLNASVITVLVAVVAYLTSREREPVRRIVEAVGIVAPLIVLSIAAQVVQPRQDTTIPLLFATHIAVSVAGVSILAWLLSRGHHLARKITAATIAAIVILIGAAAHLYLDWRLPSEVVGAVVLGLIWSLVLTLSY